MLISSKSVDESLKRETTTTKEEHQNELLEAGSEESLHESTYAIECATSTRKEEQPTMEGLSYGERLLHPAQRLNCVTIPNDRARQMIEHGIALIALDLDLAAI